MPNTKREMLLSPPSRNSMQITRTNPTRLDLNINIVIAKRLRLEVVQLELGPVLRVLDLEALERVRVNHFELEVFRVA
jgi:hypothetical protein